MVVGLSWHCHEVLVFFFLAHLSNVFPSWTDYYCVIKLSLSCFFFSKKSKEFHVTSGIPILKSSLSLSEVARHTWLSATQNTCQKQAGGHCLVHAASAPGSWWPPGSAAGAAFHPRPWEVWAVPGRQRWSQGLLSLSLILLSVSRGGPGPCL